MQSRLPRLLFFFVFSLNISLPCTYGQDLSFYSGLSPKQQKIVKEQVKSMSLSEKILALTFTDKQGAAGKQIETKLKLFSLDTVDTYAGIPFPGQATRNAAGQPLPGWMTSLFAADFFVDLPSATADVIFYGLDTTGISAQLTPYTNGDNLIEKLLDHAYLYVPSASREFLRLLENVKVKAKTKKLLRSKLREALAHELLLPGKPATAAPTTQQVVNWIWEMYRKSIKSKPLLNRLDSITVCSFTRNRHDFQQFNTMLNRITPVPVYQARDLGAADLARLTAYDLVILPMHATDSLPQVFIDALTAKTRVVRISFGQKTAAPPGQVAIPENNWLTQTLAAEVLLGGWPGNQQPEILHSGIPELVGLNRDTLALIDEILTKAIEEEAMPGCQLLVAKDGFVVLSKNYGYYTYDSLQRVTENTLYDLASITKVLATTQAMMHLVDQGSVELDTPLSTYLPYLKGTNKEKITARQVMAHQAGLYPYYPFWKKAREELLPKQFSAKATVQAGKTLWVEPAVADSILSWAARSELLAERIDTITHEQYFYSDIGFFLLKDLIEKQTGQPLDVFLYNYLYRPLGTRLAFTPTCYYPVDSIAPTEIDKYLRHERLQGFVHDRNAALMGGVSGQAGLFGNALDVAKVLQLQLNLGYYHGQRYFNKTTVMAFLSRQFAHNRRALGWDRPGNEPERPVSKLASDQTFGHSGFTGGLIWADPKENLIFVFLSNRVYPSAANTKLIDENIRTIVQGIVYRSLVIEE